MMLVEPIKSGISDHEKATKEEPNNKLLPGLLFTEDAVVFDDPSEDMSVLRLLDAITKTVTYMHKHKDLATFYCNLCHSEF